MSLTAFIGRCPHCGHDHGENSLFDVARGTLTPAQQAKVNEQFANYAKQKPHLYGGCDEITTLHEQVKKLTDECVVLRASSRSKLETISSLELQVEKLTKELDNVKQVEFPRRVQKVTDALKRKNEKELAALAEQNEKQRKALLSANDFIFTLQQDLHSERCTDWYPEGAHNAAESMSESMRLIGNSCADFTDVVEALTIPDLASPVLNRIRAEALNKAAKMVQR